jgi:hypothetical protein
MIASFNFKVIYIYARMKELNQWSVKTTNNPKN